MPFNSYFEVFLKAGFCVGTHISEFFVFDNFIMLTSIYTSYNYFFNPSETSNSGLKLLSQKYSKAVHFRLCIKSLFRKRRHGFRNYLENMVLNYLNII